MSQETAPSAPKMLPTLGLTGLTINAMALIAPGAFLWLTFEEQSLYGAPTAGCAMWFGILSALALCFATAVSYAELSKLYPGAGSSYLFAEQAFLSKHKAYKYARIVKFFTGWVSHLYYWVYPGLMVGVTAVMAGYLANQFWPGTFSATYNSPLFMILFCIVFAILIGYIAYRGVTGSTAVNIAINGISISALVVFACMAIAYRTSHKQGDVGWHLSNGNVINYQVDTTNVLDANNQPVPDAWADNSPKFQVDANNKPVLDKAGKPVPAIKQQDRAVVADDLDKTKNKDAGVLAGLTKMGVGVGDPYPVFNKDAKGNNVLDKDGAATPAPFTLSYLPADSITGSGTPQDPTTFNFHTSAISVVAPHGLNYLIVQACVAILLLVGFESVTSMGEEAKNAKRDIPKAVLLSLVVQGAICYMFEYFATNYFLNSGYTLSNAGASGAPIGDIMNLVGTWMFGSPSAGRTFMLIEAATVFLALIGTTLSCVNTGARVNYAMARDEEIPASLGALHAKNLTPHRSIWTLTVLSIFIGFITVWVYLGGQSADLAPLDKTNFWYSFGIFSPHAYTWLPNTLLIITLISNFGTFLLYMTTNIVAIVAFKEHEMFNGIKHFCVPIFGLLANLGCMIFYIVGPFSVAGMSWHEPFIALGVAAVWGIFGMIYFISGSKKLSKEMLLQTPARA